MPFSSHNFTFPSNTTTTTTPPNYKFEYWKLCFTTRYQFPFLKDEKMVMSSKNEGSLLVQVHLITTALVVVT